MKRLFAALCAATLCVALCVAPARATVNTSANKTIVLGDGTTTAFSFNFIGVAAAYISVLYTDASGNQTTLTQGSGATQYQITLNPAVTGAIWGVGGTVTYNPNGTPIPAGSTLTISRTLPLTQAISLQNLVSIATLGKGAETGLDTGVMQGQQVSEQIGRAIVANIANSSPPAPLPPASQLANKGICADGTGNNLIGCTLPSTGVISSAMQPVVNAASLALGRAAFGLGSAATENIGSYGLADDGAGTLRQSYPLASDALNQTVTAAFHNTQRICTGPLTYTLPRANTLQNGFRFWVVAASGSCTLLPNASDNFPGLAAGTAAAIPSGSVCAVSTDAANTGTWRLDCNGENISLAANASASALTITLTAPALQFRSTTLASGASLWAVPAGTLSVTIPSGATLGTSNNVPFRIWLFAAYNSGTPVLGVATCSSATAIFPCAAWETIQKSGTGMSPAATGGGTLYTSSAVTNDAVRIIGYVDYASGLATAGTWSSGPTTVQACLTPFRCKMPGDTVQTVSQTSGASSLAIAPLTAPDVIKASETFNCAAAQGAAAVINFKRGSTTLVSQSLGASGNTGMDLVAAAQLIDAPGTTAATTYSITNTGGTCGGIGATFVLDEIMG